MSLLEERFDLKPSVVAMVKLMMNIVFLAHLLACAWHFIALPVCGDDEDLPSIGPCPEDREYLRLNWVRSCGADRLNLLSRYIASFYFVTATMMAVGYGEITGTNSDERVFCIILQLFGATSFGFILSSVTTLLESANPREQEVTKKMAEIKEWLTGRAIPRSLKSEVRDHFNYAMSKKSIFNEAEILGNMPCSIRIDVIQQSYDAWLRRLAHPFPDEEMALRIELVQQLQPQQVMYDEVLIESGEISAEVYIVLHGCLEAVADANRTDLVPASNWVTNCLNRGDDHSSRFRADHSNTFATISSEEMRDEMDDGDEEFVQEAQVMKEVLCGVYGNGDLMGECQAAPIMVRGFSSRSDVLGIHRDALAYVLSRFPGALQRYDAMEDRIQLELVKVFESPESTDPVFERPVKSLVLIAGVCASSNDLPHALVKDLVRAGRKKEKELSKKALWAGSRSKTQGSLFSDGPIISKGDGTTDLAKFSRDPRADRDLITGEVTRSASSASPKVRLARSPTQQLGGTLLRWRISLNLLCQFLCPKGRSNKRGDSNILYHTRRLNPDTGEEEEVEEKQADILKRFVIPPHQRYKFRWDLIVGVLIVYSILVIPWRIGFDIVPDDGSTVFEALVDVIFFIDMILTFRTAPVDAEGTMLTVPSVIRRKYLEGWFTVDFLSTAPIDRIVEALVATDNNVGNETRVLKLVRIVRLFRLLKLARLLKMGRIVRSFEDKFELSPLTLKCMNLGGKLTLMSHFLGCFWFYTSMVHDDTDLNQCDVGYLQCDPTLPPTTWWKEIALAFEQKAELYVASLYWSFTTMTTVGYGDILPTSDSERVYAIVSMIFGATMFGYIIGSIAAIAGQERGIEALTKRRLSMVRDFCEEQRVSRKKVKEVMKHYLFLYQQRSPYNEQSILSELPIRLRKQAIKHIQREAISRLGLFAGPTLSGLAGGPYPDWFVTWTMRILEPQAVSAGEIITCAEDSAVVSELFFVYEGECEAFFPKIQRQKSSLNIGGHSDTGGSMDSSDEKNAASASTTPSSSASISGRPRTLLVFTPGTMFGLEHMTKRAATRYSFRCSRAAPCSLYCLRQSTLAEVQASVPEMVTVLRRAIAHLMIAQTQLRLPQRNLEIRRALPSHHRPR